MIRSQATLSCRSRIPMSNREPVTRRDQILVPPNPSNSGDQPEDPTEDPVVSDKPRRPQTH